MVGSENRDQMPKEDNTPEKRVDRIFDLMDKVRSMTSSGSKSHKISSKLALTKYICSCFFSSLLIYRCQRSSKMTIKGVSVDFV